MQNSFPFLSQGVPNMTRRIIKFALSACMLSVLPGCFEMTQTITLNPDGRGKVTVERIAPATFDMAMGLMGGPGGEKKPSLDEIRKNGAKNFLMDTDGVKAFKDVSAAWLRDGRLKIVGTLYFDRLDDRSKKLADLAKDLGKDQPPDIDPTMLAGMFSNMNFLSPALQVSALKDGSLRINVRKTEDKAGGKSAGKEIPNMLKAFNPFTDKDEAIDIAKMNDKELEEHLLEMRVSYAMMRPMLEGMFGSLKIKTVLQLPGDVGDLKGFKKDGPRSVSISLDGSEIIDVMKKVMMMDAPEARKLAQAKDAKDFNALFGTMPDLDDASVTARNLGAAQFDFDKEVSEARAAYPALRKSLGLPDEFKLPGGGK